MFLRRSISIIIFVIFINKVSLVQLLETPPESEIEPGTLNATEQLLELIVKISADPRPWRQALNLIDNTKKGAVEFKNEEASNKSAQQDIEELRSLAKDRKKPRYYYTYNSKRSQKDNSTESDSKIKKVGDMTNNNNGRLTDTMNDSIKDLNTNNQQILQNKNNNNFNNGNKFVNPFPYQKYKSQLQNHPLLNKRPKAYIAISVIAQKPWKEESILDQELKLLKQWPHKIQPK